MWLKAEAARRGIPMYLVIERLVAKASRGRVWERR
jgi:hypothetical protein